jgi:two-component system response regulator PilR (NtrC family)
MGRRMGTDAPQIGEDAFQMLRGYPFPGNVRELENILERALTLCTNGPITTEHIKLRAAARPVPELTSQPSTSAASASVGGSAALGAQLEDIERDAIVKALEKTRFNKTAAAKVLGMSFRALRYRIKKLGIE